MAVKPAAGEVVVEEKRTRIESPANSKDASQERLLPIWDFVDSVDDSYLQKCEFQIYRGKSSQKAEEKTYIGKFYERINPDVIQRRWGGGQYNVWLKLPIGNTDKLQLKYNVDLIIEGPQKTYTESAPAAGASSSEIGQVLAMMREDRQMFMAAIERLSGSGSTQEAVKQALLLNGQVFSAAVPAVVNTLERAGAASGAANPSGMDDITKEFLRAAIAKMLNPADPIENFSKMAAAMGSLGFKMGGGPTGGVAVELGRALIGALPQLAAHVGGIMDQYRRAEEAKLQQVRLVRGGSPAHVITQTPAPAAPIPAAPAPAPAPEQSNVIEMPAPGAETAANPGEQMSPEQTTAAEQLFQYVETKVVALLLDATLTPEEAANDALVFIDVTDKNLVDELLRHGEPGLRWAFSNREILKQVPVGPRLDAFIAEFVAKGRKVPMPTPPVPDPNIPPA